MKTLKHIATMDTITTENTHYENNFVCVLEDRYTQEEVEKLLNGESVLDYEEEEDCQYWLSVSLYDDSDVSNLTLPDDDVIII